MEPPPAVPVAVAEGVALTEFTPAPPFPEVEAARPPVPPAPPVAVVLREFTASPVVPEMAVASDWEPELALLDARPVLDDAPVGPLAATVVGGAWLVPRVAGAAAAVGWGSVAGGEVWATAAPPQKTRRAATTAPTEAETLEIFREPGLPEFMLIPCRWGRRWPCRYSRTCAAGPSVRQRAHLSRYDR